MNRRGRSWQHTTMVARGRSSAMPVTLALRDRMPCWVPRWLGGGHDATGSPRMTSDEDRRLQTICLKCGRVVRLNVTLPKDPRGARTEATI